MKHIKIFEEFINEGILSVNEGFDFITQRNVFEPFFDEQIKLLKIAIKNKDEKKFKWVLQNTIDGIKNLRKRYIGESVNESKKTAKLLENEDAYLLHRLAGNIGQEVAAEFLKDNDLDLNLLSKAIQQKTINKYQLRDIVRGDTGKALIKRFIKRT
tara:strand:- start:1864 stop:2331 length:468 start_codon:yes stop_codon:yes gene_type:complete